MASLIPVEEEERLAAVQRYAILDTPPDGAFDRITSIAARLFDAPISTITIVDRDRIWFKAHHGLDVDEIGREPGLCASAILQYDPWVVSNARVDPRTLDNPLVVGELGLCFYAGVPLTTSDGYNLGTLNVIDQAPREVDEDALEHLRDLAAIVMDELELRIAAQREERRLDEVRTDLATTVSHELRTPVSAIYGAAATLRRGRDVVDAETESTLVEIIHDETERLSRIVNDIMLASELTAGRFTILRELVDPAALVRDAVAAARSRLPEQFTLEGRVPEKPVPTVNGDGGRIRQLLGNLLENAVKYSPDGGRIEVSVEPRGETVRFAVSDEGLGVPSDEQSAIFQKFYRLDPDLKTGVSGVGLGLYVCRELVELMGGTIGVESSEGAGSTFFFDLPAAS